MYLIWKLTVPRLGASDDLGTGSRGRNRQDAGKRDKGDERPHFSHNSYMTKLHGDFSIYLTLSNVISDYPH